eukprot:988958-Amphidinium_carterae.2
MHIPRASSGFKQGALYREGKSCWRYHVIPMSIEIFKSLLLLLSYALILLRAMQFDKQHIAIPSVLIA